MIVVGSKKNEGTWSSSDPISVPLIETAIQTLSLTVIDIHLGE